MQMSGEEKEHWTLDKRVPLALIIAISIQTAAGVWFLAKLDSRVGSLEETRQVTAPQSDRLTRVEVKIEGIQATTDRIERLIRKEP